MSSQRQMLATIWRIASPYFNGEDRWAGRGLLAAVIAIELSIVGLSVLFNQWNARFFNALQERAWDSFVRELAIFSALAAVFVALAIYQIYLNQWLQIRWRKWMTERFLGDWLNDARHYRMQLTGQPTDNPDQRIAEDLKQFAQLGLDIGLKLLNAIVTLMSFVIILWGLSAAAPLVLFGTEWAIPGYLVWAALIYAIVGTVLTQWIGKPLIGLNFEMQKYEADFRFNLVRVRENAEQIALLKGEAAEREHLLRRFQNVVTNWLALMSRQKRLTTLTSTYSQVAVVFPFILASPAYFANKIQLGALTQTVSAFGSVQDSLSFIITVYRYWAEFQSVVLRLDGFQTAVNAARAGHPASPRGVNAEAGASGVMDIDSLALHLPNGKPLVTVAPLSLKTGESVLVTGRSGLGKSTFLRAISGIWPFAQGTIKVPTGARIVTLPQRPYFPIGTLADAMAYPSLASEKLHGRLAELLSAVGLAQLAARLNDHEHWNTVLSGGEQQRLALARAILQKPDFLLLDEATASLDEQAEGEVYQAIRRLLPSVTVLSIGHRATLTALHDRSLPLAGETTVQGAP